MDIAIVGAGLSGLSIAWHLLMTRKCTVTLYDAQGVGAGASGIAAGLMHPYPGQMARRSFLAQEGIAATKRLLAAAQEKSAFALANTLGIIRYAHTAAMRDAFVSHAAIFKDVEPYKENSFLIRSGMTIFCKRYLWALWLCVQERGGILKKQPTHSLQELSSHDRIVLAAGAGVSQLLQAAMPKLPIELLKGQLLTCRIPQEIDFPPQSIIGTSYIAHAGEKGLCHIGSTYERGALDARPDLKKTQKELTLKTQLFYPQAALFDILDCQAAFRVARIGHYCPIVERLSPHVWMCTALGSRGLLYHALLGQFLSQAIFEDDPDLIPKPLRIS